MHLTSTVQRGSECGLHALHNAIIMFRMAFQLSRALEGVQRVPRAGLSYVNDVLATHEVMTLRSALSDKEAFLQQRLVIQESLIAGMVLAARSYLQKWRIDLNRPDLLRVTSGLSAQASPALLERIAWHVLHTSSSEETKLASQQLVPGADHEQVVALANQELRRQVEAKEPLPFASTAPYRDPNAPFLALDNLSGTDMDTALRAEGSEVTVVDNIFDVLTLQQQGSSHPSFDRPVAQFCRQGFTTLILNTARVAYVGVHWFAIHLTWLKNKRRVVAFLADSVGYEEQWHAETGLARREAYTLGVHWDILQSCVRALIVGSQRALEEGDCVVQRWAVDLKNSRTELLRDALSGKVVPFRAELARVLQMEPGVVVHASPADALYEVIFAANNPNPQPALALAVAVDKHILALVTAQLGTMVNNFLGPQRALQQGLAVLQTMSVQDSQQALLAWWRTARQQMEARMPRATGDAQPEPRPAPRNTHPDSEPLGLGLVQATPVIRRDIVPPSEDPAAPGIGL